MTGCQVTYYGPFSIVADDGTDLTPKGAKARALIVLLLDAPERRRSRRWLESKLWSDRGAKQASGSLRQTLTEIRASFGKHSALLVADRINIELAAEPIKTDLVDENSPDGADWELLEGLDVRDPEFEEWLTLFRQRHNRSPDSAISKALPLQGFNVRCEVNGDPDGRERLTAHILSDQVGRNVEDMLSAWRIDGSATSTTALGDIIVTSEAARDGTANVFFVRVTHEQTGRVLYSGFRQQQAQPSEMLSEEFITEFAHSAATRSLAKLPHAVGLDRPETVATGFANLAMRRLYCFDPRQLSEAGGLMANAFDADRNGLYLAWRGFIRMAQVIDRLDPAGPELKEEVEGWLRQALELSPDNAQVLALVSLTRMMLFDEIDLGARLAERALAANQGNLLARQSLAFAYGATGRAGTAYDISRFCQSALAREDVRHLWDLYHSLVCIATNRLEEALQSAREASKRCPDFLAPRRQILALAANVGDIDSARSEMRALERLEPGFTLERYLYDASYPVDTLRKFGLLNFPISILTG